MSETPAGQRLTPAQVLLIVVVSVLVVIFVVLLVGRLTGGSSEPGADASAVVNGDSGQPEPSTPGGNASPEPSEDPTEVADPEYFASPSGNIVCALTVDSTDCVISNFSYEPEDAGSCEDEAAGSHLRVEAAGASMPCDPIVVAGDVPSLDYGDSASAHGYTCESEESGVTCRHDESGYGFSLARAAYELF